MPIGTSDGEIFETPFDLISADFGSINRQNTYMEEVGTDPILHSSLGQDQAFRANFDVAKPVASSYEGYFQNDPIQKGDMLTASKGDKLDQAVATPPVQAGMVPGNIDLNNRPVVRNADGSISTVRSITFEDNGKHIVIPTVKDDGTIMTGKEAIAEYDRTGRHLGIFDNEDEANKFAQQLHLDQEKLYTQNSPKTAITVRPTTDQGWGDWIVAQHEKAFGPAPKDWTTFVRDALVGLNLIGNRAAGGVTPARPLLSIPKARLSEAETTIVGGSRKITAVEDFSSEGTGVGVGGDTAYTGIANAKTSPGAVRGESSTAGLEAQGVLRSANANMDPKILARQLVDEGHDSIPAMYRNMGSGEWRKQLYETFSDYGSSRLQGNTNAGIDAAWNKLIKEQTEGTFEHAVKQQETKQIKNDLAKRIRGNFQVVEGGNQPTPMEPQQHEAGGYRNAEEARQILARQRAAQEIERSYQTYKEVPPEDKYTERDPHFVKAQQMVAEMAQTPRLTPAIRIKGQQFTGEAHWIAFEKAQKEFGPGVAEPTPENEGFIDSRGTWYSRAAAMEYAKKFDLMNKSGPRVKNYLMSEDLK
jgi:hypothetical protein